MPKLTVNVDGGARGNPGPAAIGVVVRDEDGEIVEAVGETIGKATNNVAEYKALLRGVELAAAHGATELELIGDSELIIRQVEGRYKVKNEGMKPLHAEAKKGLAAFDKWSVRHVKRAQNADADALVNEALDNA
jgi:ribonuclease HI